MSRFLRTLLTPGNRFGVLLVSLLFMLFLPFLLPHALAAIVTPVLFTIVLLSSLSAVADTPERARFGAMLAVPGCALVVVTSIIDTPRLAMLAEGLAVAFLAYVGIQILAFVLRARRADLGIVLGSVCVYLLVALMWGIGYALLEGLQPGSFALPVEADADADNMRNALQYFSFVTITTLGYGDIQPVARLARMLSTLEAVVGQLYLVILVARLVGLHTAAESQTPGREG